MPLTSERLTEIGSRFVAALAELMRGPPASNTTEIEDCRAERYYGYDPYNSDGRNTMRYHWIPCRALDERISIANQLQLTPHRDW